MYMSGMQVRVRVYDALGVRVEVHCVLMLGPKQGSDAGPSQHASCPSCALKDVLC